MDPHREEFLHLAHVSHDRALVTWGAFFFEPHGGEHRLIEHEDLAKPPINRARGCIGLETDGYGPASVRVTRVTEDGSLAEARDVPVPDGRNHVWVEDLEPDTRYEYVVTVNGKVWGASPSDLSGNGRKGVFTPATWRYDTRFTTFPAPGGAGGPVTFAVLGDQGTGKDGQYDIAARLEDAIEPVRFIITTGDNVYAQVKNKGLLGQIEKGFRILTKNLLSSGNEDDDWFATFYRPYRRIISHVPVFPALGNHDQAETENAADLDQHIDNFFLSERFPDLAPAWIDAQGVFHTLFYRFRCGPSLEMVAIDTGEPQTDPAFERPRQKQFIDHLLKNDTAGWRIPYSHHPPFSVGPVHDHEPNVQNLGNQFAGLDSFRLWLSGHEHNFQHHRMGDLHYVVTGASGKRDGGVDQDRVLNDVSCCHGDELHFLLVTVDGSRATLRAIGTGGAQIATKPLANLPPHPFPIEISL